MSSSTDSDQRLALIHQGWDHLQRQRPLAAWASWHRALRIKPDDPAVRPDRLGQEIEDSSRPAAEVDRGLTGPQAELAKPAEQGAGFRLQFLRLALQPGGLIGVGAEGVHLGRVVRWRNGGVSCVMGHGRIVADAASGPLTSDLRCTYHGVQHPRPG